MKERRGSLHLWCQIALSLAVTLLAATPSPSPAQTGTTVTGASRVMNPAISMNGTFAAEWHDHRSEGEQESHLHLQEIELAAMSVVDPYFKANIFTSFGPGHTHAEDSHDQGADGESGEEGEHEHGDAIEVEEVYVRTLFLPPGWGGRMGKMLVPFGRLNRIHLHHLPFIEMQHGFRELVGPHGVSDVGAEIAYAPPTPWYLNLLGFVGEGGVGLFDPENDEFAYAGRVENLWDLGESATVELAGSVLTGLGHEESRRTLYGVDARFKWRDQRKTYGHALECMTELLVDSPEGGEEQSALASFARFRFSRSWWFGAGYSFLDLPGDSGTDHEGKAQLAWVPSEFSTIRFDLSYLDSRAEGHLWTAMLQVNFTIGSHPAHLY